MLVMFDSFDDFFFFFLLFCAVKQTSEKTDKKVP